MTSKILRNQKIIRNGSAQYASSGGEVHNATQLTLPLSFQRKLIPILNNPNSDRELSTEDVSTLNEFFDLYVNKLKDNFQMYSVEAEKIHSYRSTFLGMEPANKISLLKQLLTLTSASATLPNVKNYGFSSSFGRKNLQRINLEDTTFIFESITGLKAREVAGAFLR